MSKSGKSGHKSEQKWSFLGVDKRVQNKHRLKAFHGLFAPEVIPEVVQKWVQGGPRRGILVAEGGILAAEGVHYPALYCPVLPGVCTGPG